MTRPLAMCLALAPLALGCGPPARPPLAVDAGPAPAPGDTAPAPTADAGAVIDTAAPADADTPPGPAVCVATPARRPGQRPVITVGVDLTYAGKPVAFGQPFALATGTLTITEL